MLTAKNWNVPCLLDLLLCSRKILQFVHLRGGSSTAHACLRVLGTSFFRPVHLFLSHSHACPPSESTMELSSWRFLVVAVKFLLVASPRPHAHILFLAGDIPEDQEGKTPQVCVNHICPSPLPSVIPLLHSVCWDF